MGFRSAMSTETRVEGARCLRRCPHRDLGPAGRANNLGQRGAARGSAKSRSGSLSEMRLVAPAGPDGQRRSSSARSTSSLQPARGSADSCSAVPRRARSAMRRPVRGWRRRTPRRCCGRVRGRPRGWLLSGRRRRGDGGAHARSRSGSRLRIWLRHGAARVEIDVVPVDPAGKEVVAPEGRRRRRRRGRARRWRTASPRRRRVRGGEVSGRGAGVALRARLRARGAPGRRWLRSRLLLRGWAVAAIWHHGRRTRHDPGGRPSESRRRRSLRLGAALQLAGACGIGGQRADLRPLLLRLRCAWALVLPPLRHRVRLPLRWYRRLRLRRVNCCRRRGRRRRVCAVALRPGCGAAFRLPLSQRLLLLLVDRLGAARLLLGRLLRVVPGGRIFGGDNGTRRSRRCGRRAGPLLALLRGRGDAPGRLAGDGENGAIAWAAGPARCEEARDGGRPCANGCRHAGRMSGCACEECDWARRRMRGLPRLLGEGS